MTFLKSILLIGLLVSGNNLFSQSYRLTAEEKRRDLEVFLMPGIDPNGARLFQFSIHTLKDLSVNVKTDSITLITSDGNQIILIHPYRDTNYLHEKIVKGWYPYFALNKDQIEISKTQKLKEIVLFIDKKRRVIIVPETVASEINALIAARF